MSNILESTSWWLHQDGNVTGPYTENYITAGLKSNVIPQDAQACLVGSEEWKPFGNWPVFASLINVDSVPALPNLMEPNVDSSFTNPQLPKMANWICMYCILIHPILFGICLMKDLVGDNSLFTHTSKLSSIMSFISILDLLFSISMTVVLMVGGLRLRNLRQSGIIIIKRMIWGYFAFGGTLILTVIMLVFLCPPDFFIGE